MSAPLGINLCFACKRWPEPETWAALVREELGLTHVQFTYDLLDPWWPEDLRLREAERVRAAVDSAGISIHSAQIGLAWYTYSGLLSPDSLMRVAARSWWERAIEVAARVGARAAGGPLGALSVTSNADPGERERRFEELVDALAGLQVSAARAGLEALLVEPTPLDREIPSSVEEAQRLAAALQDGPVPVKYVLDNGHALLEPFYGSQASLRSWLEGLGDTIGAFHLQNTDRQSDSHWGWPDPRADLDVASWAHDVALAGLASLPIFIEVVHPFELSDHDVLASLRSTVAHCREVLG